MTYGEICNNQLEDEVKKVLCSVFKNLFGIGSPFPDLKREHKPIPLKRKGDINCEVQWRTTDIEKDGHKVIHIDQNRYGETVMIYRLFHHDGLDDRDIHLRIKIITPKGVKTPDSNAFLIVYPETKLMKIADIRIEGDRVGRGYGSILMTAIMQLVDQLQIRFITGWISGVDWDHIDRSEHFYRKFGFECELNHEAQSGRITWINQALGATREELEKLID
jgi:GNAT superfamily N-acetyltransferase